MLESLTLGHGPEGQAARWTKIGDVAALYRKYRPQDFDEVVGQEAVVRTLKNAIEHDQLRPPKEPAGNGGFLVSEPRL